jgi:adenine/guanine/hypoxanthine permease
MRTYRIFTVVLMMYHVRGALLIGIFLTSIISWPRPTPVTAFPHTPTGDAAFAFFKQVVAFHPITKIGNALDVCPRNFLLVVRKR